MLHGREVTDVRTFNPAGAAQPVNLTNSAQLRQFSVPAAPPGTPGAFSDMSSSCQSECQFTHTTEPTIDVIYPPFVANALLVGPDLMAWLPVNTYKDYKLTWPGAGSSDQSPHVQSPSLGLDLSVA